MQQGSDDLAELVALSEQAAMAARADQGVGRELVKGNSSFGRGTFGVACRIPFVRNGTGPQRRDRGFFPLDDFEAVKRRLAEATNATSAFDSSSGQKVLNRTRARYRLSAKHVGDGLHLAPEGMVSWEAVASISVEERRASASSSAGSEASTRSRSRGSSGRRVSDAAECGELLKLVEPSVEPAWYNVDDSAPKPREVRTDTLSDTPAAAYEGRPWADVCAWEAWKVRMLGGITRQC